MSYSKCVYRDIKVATDGHVAIVTISRPAAHNAWSGDTFSELLDIYTKLEDDPEIRVIVMTGDPAGKAFCVGADLNVVKFSRPDETATQARDRGGRFALAVYKSRKVTMAAINGNAAGIGITQTLPMDFRFAWSGAKIVFPFVRRGLVPEATSTYFLPRLIGQSRALAVMLQGSPKLTAASPLLGGLFAHLLPTPEDVLPYTLQVAHEIAARTSPASVAYTKSLTFNVRDTPEEQHLLDSRAMYVLDHHPDSKEGISAFLQKRAPRFQNFKRGDLPEWAAPSDKEIEERIGRLKAWMDSKL